MTSITIIGGGLAGSEAAWQLAQNNIHVKLYEMRPNTPTGAHLSGNVRIISVRRSRDEEIEYYENESL